MNHSMVNIFEIVPDSFPQTHLLYVISVSQAKLYDRLVLKHALPFLLEFVARSH